MLEESFLENAETIWAPNFLMIFQLSFKFFNVLKPYYVSHENFMHYFEVWVHQLTSLILM